MTVVDASIVVRLLLNKSGDTDLRARFRHERYLHGPALIDAEVTSAIRGLLMTTKPTIRISAERAAQMLDVFADLPLVRYSMQLPTAGYRAAPQLHRLRRVLRCPGGIP